MEPTGETQECMEGQTQGEEQGEVQTQSCAVGYPKKEVVRGCSRIINSESAREPQRIPALSTKLRAQKAPRGRRALPILVLAHALAVLRVVGKGGEGDSEGTRLTCGRSLRSCTTQRETHAERHQEQQQGGLESL